MLVNRALDILLKFRIPWVMKCPAVILFFACLAPLTASAQSVSVSITGDAAINGCGTKSYTISIQNDSGDPLTNLVIIAGLETLAGFYYIPGTTSIDLNGGGAFCTADPVISGGYSGNCAPGPGTPYLTWDIDSLCGVRTLNNGDTLNITFQLTTDCTAASGSLNAYIDYDLPGLPNQCDDTGLLNIQVNPRVLTIEKTRANVPIGCGDVIQWTIRVTNNSGYTLPILWIEDTMDAAFTYLSSVGDPPYTSDNGTNAGQVTSWELRNVNDRHTVTLSLAATTDSAPCSYYLDNTVTAYWGCGAADGSSATKPGEDPPDDPFCLTGTGITGVRTETRQPELDFFSIGTSPVSIDACNDSTEITVLLVNTGSTDASDVDLVVTLPAGMTYMDGTSKTGLGTDDTVSTEENKDPDISGSTLTFYNVGDKGDNIADTIEADGGNDTLVLKFSVRSSCYITDTVDFNLRYYDCCDDTQYSIATEKQIAALSPSLSVTQTPSDSQVDCGTQQTWNITVTNNGDGNAQVVRIEDNPGHWIDVRTGQPGDPEDMGGGVYGWEVNNLAANGGSEALTLVGTLNPDGLPNQADCTAGLRQNNFMAVWGCGTSGDAIDNYPTTTTDYDCEDGNAAQAPEATLQMPNLTVTSITPAISCTGDGCFSGTISVRVTNNGDGATSGPFTVQVTDGKGWTGTATYSTAIASGGSADVTIDTATWPPDCQLCAAPYSFNATVDLGNDICECNEKDNTTGSPTQYSPPIPDVTVTDIDFDLACSGDEISGDVTVTIENQGVGDAGAFEVGLETDGCFGAPANLPVASLASGAVTTVTFNLPDSWATCADGDCLFTATVDPAGHVCECDGTHNARAETNPPFRSKLFWSDATDDLIQKADRDGSGIEGVTGAADGLDEPRGVAVHETLSRIYWVNGAAGTIQRADLNGANVQEVASGLTAPVDIALDPAGSKMYWSDNGDRAIHRADLNGGNSETPITGLGDIGGLALDVNANKIYWTNPADGEIRRADLNGLNQQLLITDLSNPLGIALDLSGSKIYFSDSGAGKIQRADPDGSNVEDVVIGLGGDVSHLALDETEALIYFGTNNATIRRVGFDGTGLQDVITGLTNGMGVALYSPPSGYRLVDPAVNSVTPVVSRDGQGNMSGSVTVNVSNHGRNRADGADVRLTSDCGIVFSDQSINLAPSADQDVVFSYAPGCTDNTCTFTAKIDPDDTICECSNNTNTKAAAPYAVTVPDIEVKGGTPLTVIPNGDISPSTAEGTYFGTINPGENVARTFTIENVGRDILTLSGTPPVDLSDETHFTVTRQPTSPINAHGGTDTFDIIYNPTSGGTHNATVTIANDDCDESAYVFAIEGFRTSYPNVTTMAVSSITLTTASSGGHVIADGGAEVSSRGVCWSTAPNPTTAADKTSDGTGTGGFASSITGLSAGTTYHVRAYATNGAGTGYGNEVSFATLPNPPSTPTATAASGITASVFTANWNAEAGATGYRLDVSTTADFSSFVSGYEDMGVGDVTSIGVINLTGGINYYYRVRSYNTGGTSTGSNVIQVTTLCAAPIATAATNVTQTGFTANWTASTGSTGYRLDISTTSDFSNYVSGYKEVLNDTSCAVTGLSSGTSHYYRVRAVNATGTSENSNTITVGTGKLPTRVGLTGPADVNAGAVSTAFTLTSRDKNGDPADVNEDTVFQLTSTSTGTYGFYSDSTGKLPVTQITISNGTQTATFYYRDTTAGTPTVFATRTGGMSLGSANQRITVKAGTVSGTVFYDVNGNGILDDGEPGIAFVTVEILDAQGSVTETLTTNEIGVYRFNGVSPGNYTVRETDLAEYTSTTSNLVPVSMAANGAATADFGDQLQGMVSGSVFLDINGNGIQDPDEPGIGNVTVKLVNSVGHVAQTVTTFDDGIYEFINVSSGCYTVRETDPAGFTSATSNTVPISVATGGSAAANFGDQFQGTVTGHVFLDINGNGIQDPDEPGISGVTVKLMNSSGGTEQTDTTGDNGSYEFTGVSIGCYTVQETDPVGYISTTVNTVPVSVTASGGVTANFGVHETGTVSGTVFNDTNGDGTRNFFEKGIGGVRVTLLTGGTVSSTATTVGDGSYAFTGVTSGNYTVQETDPAGYESTTGNTVDVLVGSDPATASFGDIPLGTVSGVVYNDTNGNGVQDPGENGVGGVTINLLDDGNAVLDTAITAGDGVYLFENLSAGTYTVEDIYPSGYTGTTTNRVTVTVGVQATAQNRTNRGSAVANFGVLQEKSVSGIVFNDTNGNGVQDPGEGGVGGVLIRLLDNLGSVESTTHTAGDGTYGFFILASGDYDIQETYPSGYTGTTDRLVAVTITDGRAGTANFGILQGDAPDHVTLEGPSSATLNTVSNAFTLTSRNSDNNLSNVTSDTVFSLTSDSSGTAAFYSDTAGTNAINQITLADGTYSTTFYYKDSAPGTPTVTATRLSGMNLGNGTHQITVNGSPDTQASDIGFSDVSQSQMKVGWTRGNGNKVLLAAHEGSAVDSNPVDGTAYPADAAFGKGGEIGTGNFVVYKGTGTSVTVTGLTKDTVYYFRAYEFNGVVDEKYNTNEASGNPNSHGTVPDAPVAAAATNVTETGFTANWNGATRTAGYFLDVALDGGFKEFVTGYENRDVGAVTSFAITGLTAVTEYFYRVRFSRNGVISDNSKTIRVTTSDGTGVPAEIQNAAPNNGDGNDDGIKDSLQTSVASLPCASDGSYLTVELSGCGQLTNVAACSYESTGKPDAGFEYPFGLVGFDIPCGSATVRIYYHGAKNGLDGYTYRKFGPTPSDWSTSIWYTMGGATYGNKKIEGGMVPLVEFLLTEAELGDDTPVFPIVDQGGVAVPAVIPTLNEWGMIILGLLTAVLAFRR